MSLFCLPREFTHKRGGAQSPHFCSRIFAVKQRVTNSFNLSFKRNVCEARHVLLDSFASGSRVGQVRLLLSRGGGGGPGVCLNSEPGLTARNWATN